MAELISSFRTRLGTSTSLLFLIFQLALVQSHAADLNAPTANGSATNNAASASAPTASTDESLARSIVEKADLIRLPQEGFQVDISIATSRRDQSTEERKYRVLSKGNNSTVIMVTEPASDRGQIILMKDRDLWVFMPDISQPIRISVSQRLTGQVANGDLARANFAQDYNAQIVRTEMFDGEITHVLELTAVDRGVTYQRVLYWVRQKNNWPYKAEFYSLSNRLLKTCKYENFQTMAGKTRPTRLVMADALNAGDQSVLDYSAMKLRELPDKIFTKEYLKKLE